MGGWKSTQKAFLVLEVIKMCDKDLLGYFVQCLYQRFVWSTLPVYGLPVVGGVS